MSAIRGMNYSAQSPLNAIRSVAGTRSCPSVALMLLTESQSISPRQPERVLPHSPMMANRGIRTLMVRNVQRHRKNPRPGGELIF